MVFDLKRVNEIDSTGAKIMLQTHDRLTQEGKMLLLSSFEERTRLAGFLKDMGVTAALTRNRLFHDTDRAIEWAEDHLISASRGTPGETPNFRSASSTCSRAWRKTNWRSSNRCCRAASTARAKSIFREGDESRELYVIAKGQRQRALAAARQQPRQRA